MRRSNLRRSTPRDGLRNYTSALFFNGQPLLARLDRSFIRALFAPSGQPIFALLIFVKLVLCLPRLAPTAQLFFHAINNPMALLVYKIFSENFAVSEFLAPVIMGAFSTSSAQTVFLVSVTAKLALIFPFLASTAPFQFCFDFSHGRNYSDIRDNCQLFSLFPLACQQ